MIDLTGCNQSGYGLVRHAGVPAPLLPGPAFSYWRQLDRMEIIRQHLRDLRSNRVRCPLALLHPVHGDNTACVDRKIRNINLVRRRSIVAPSNKRRIVVGDNCRSALHQAIQNVVRVALAFAQIKRVAYPERLQGPRRIGRPLQYERVNPIIGTRIIASQTLVINRGKIQRVRQLHGIR